jgi:hypothetical protein
MGKPTRRQVAVGNRMNLARRICAVFQVNCGLSIHHKLECNGTRSSTFADTVGESCLTEETGLSKFNSALEDQAPRRYYCQS